MADDVERLVDRRLRRLLDEFPAVSIVGPRAVGKTTSARRMAGSVVRLDRPAEAAVFEADADVAGYGAGDPADDASDVADVPPRLFHLRNQDARHEVDLIVELGGGRVVAIEVKAASAPTRHDARHLEWLRDELGDRFAAGVLLHTGPRAFSVADPVTAAPISTLWAAGR